MFGCNIFMSFISHSVCVRSQIFLCRFLQVFSSENLLCHSCLVFSAWRVLVCGWLFSCRYNHEQLLPDFVVLISFLTPLCKRDLFVAIQKLKHFWKIYPWERGAPSCCCLIQGLGLFSRKDSLLGKKHEKMERNSFLVRLVSENSLRITLYINKALVFVQSTQLNFCPGVKLNQFVL